VTLALLLAFGLPASPAIGKPPLRVISASGESRGVAVFKLRGLDASRVRAAWVAADGPGRRGRKGGHAAAARSGSARGRLKLSLRRQIRVSRLRLAARRGFLRLRVRGAARRQARRTARRAKLVVSVGRSGECGCSSGSPGQAVEKKAEKHGKGNEPPEESNEPPEEGAEPPEEGAQPSEEEAPDGGEASGGDSDCAEAGVSEGFGSFDANNWPNGCWRPFGDASPFNSRIPATPRIHANSAAIVDTLTGWGEPADLRAGIADTSSDWDHPIYYSKPSDPVFTLHCTESWGTCEIEGHRIRIPQQARAAAGGDAHMAVVDQASGWEYDLYKYCYEGCGDSGIRTLPQGGGDVYFRWGGRTRIDGDGLGSDATAAHFGLTAGVIRAGEMERGRIDHALFIMVRCDSGQKVFPAGGLGAKCSSSGNAPAEGMRFQLAMSAAQIDALSVPAWKKTILRAMAEYGMYVGDTTGSTPWNLVFESGSTYTSFGAEDRLARFAKQAGVRQSSDGRYYFDVAGGIDWQRHLRVVDPCVAQGACA